GERRKLTKPLDGGAGPGSRAAEVLSEVGLDVVLGTLKACFQRGDEGILTYLNQARSACAFLVDYRGGSRNKRLLGDAVEVAGPALDICARFYDLLPAHFGKRIPGPWFYRRIFHLLHSCSPFQICIYLSLSMYQRMTPWS